jgi:hypothetical protein
LWLSKKREKKKDGKKRLGQILVSRFADDGGRGGGCEGRKLKKVGAQNDFGIVLFLGRSFLIYTVIGFKNSRPKSDCL